MAKFRQYFCIICKNHAFYPAYMFQKKFCKRCYDKNIEGLTMEDIEFAIPDRKSVPVSKACMKKKKQHYRRED